MKWMTWKALVPPAALPLAVSVAVALAGPGGFFASTPSDAPAALVGDIRPTDGAHTQTPIATPAGPIFLEAEVVVMVKNYTITSMATVAVVSNWCTSDWLGSAWGASCQIVDPACKAFTDLGLPCPLTPLALNFYVYEAAPTIVPADEATTLILQLY